MTKNPIQDTGASSPFQSHFGGPDTTGVAIDETPLVKRICRASSLSFSDQAADYSPSNRKQLGGKGMFLQRMQAIEVPVPPFKCVTARAMNALEQHPLDTHCLARYLQGIVPEPEAECSLMKIRELLNTLPPSEQDKRNEWLEGLATFVASSDFYEQVKDSEVARHMRDLRSQLIGLSTSQPLIVRSSGINEDDYGDAQAGKYLSEVQGEEDVLRTCLKVMASGYRPEVCPGVIPPPMALIIQQCIDCQYGGVAMSFQSFQDDTVRVEYTPGQPRGVVAGQSGNTPHRIDIFREEGAKSWQYFPGTVSNPFILQKNSENNGYSETRIDDAKPQSDDGRHILSDDTVSTLREMVTKLEGLLLCPVDVEFAIDHQGCLFLLQVRPITRLTGDMEFAVSVPEDSLASGEAVSEGYCTGSIWLAKKGASDTMPEGAIVVAHHAQEWMLEPGFLKRAGGFVFAEGGFNDHVAILMRQEVKTLMLAGEQFAAVAVHDGQQATLACARFNGQPGAFIIAGDLTEKLASHRSLSSAVSDVPLATAVPSWDDLSPSEDTFSQVARGFQWLTDQNARLLAFFASGGGLDCLANPIKLSMSPQRSKILAETKESVKRLIYGAEAQLKGYRAFLLLAGEKGSSGVKPLLKDLSQLSNRFEALKQTIGFGLESIILPMQAAEEGQVSQRLFRQWVSACHQLQSCLQALDPRKAEQVLSVHELIFALHQCFIKALAPVALASGRGRLTRERDVTYVDCTTPGKTLTLLSPSCKASIKKSGLSATVVSLDDVLIVNLMLGFHVGLIELLEHAEGGKGRTLRLKFSDVFNEFYCDHKVGKLKRMWFLVQLLKAIELDKNADGIKLSCNAVAGEIIIEWHRMESRETMQDAFGKLLIVLDAMFNLDQQLEHTAIFEGDQWDFNLLAQRLNRQVVTEADRFAFQHCLFSLFYRKGYCITPACCQLLSDHLQQIVNLAERLDECQWLVLCGRKPEDSVRKMLMSDEISEDARKEVLHHFLLFDPKNAIRVVEHVYDLRNQYFIINRSYSYRLNFYIPPFHSLPDNKEKLKNVLLKHGLKYASQRVRNDRELVLEAIAKHPLDLQYASEEMKRDKEVVLAAVNRNGYCMGHASPKLQDDYEFVMTAVEKSPEALRYASERIRRDKNIINSVIAHSIKFLMDASETVLNDRDYILDLIAKEPLAFKYAAAELQRDKAFIDSAILRNPKVIEYTRKCSDKV
nr:DUF4116 domain-containing protein [Endozoicomonas sp. ISHI1]